MTQLLTQWIAVSQVAVVEGGFREIVSPTGIHGHRINVITPFSDFGPRLHISTFTLPLESGPNLRTKMMLN